jgi:hypothetical protein
MVIALAPMLILNLFFWLCCITVPSTASSYIRRNETEGREEEKNRLDDLQDKFESRQVLAMQLLNTTRCIDTMILLSQLVVLSQRTIGYLKHFRSKKDILQLVELSDKRSNKHVVQ